MNKDKDIYGEGGGGSGCFPAGTLINTPVGYRKIEDIMVGDEVYALDISSIEPGEISLPGQVVLQTVTETFIHEFGDVGYKSKLLIITHSEGELVVTGNHYVMTPSRQSKDVESGFARADALQVGDTLFGEYGESVTILSIEKGSKYDYVYNFEVNQVHTYIASKIRVHNGGGGKSSGGGSARAAVQAPNSIRTNQIARVLNLVSEGDTFGPWNTADPAKSIFFNNTPLKNSDGSLNYTNIQVGTRTGEPSQTVISGFSAVETESVFTNPILNGTPVVKTLGTDIDAVRVTIEFTQGLQAGDQSTGDTNGTSVNFIIARRVSAGTWTDYSNITVKEMSSGPFEVAYRVPRVGSGVVWEYRVTRVTANNSNNFIKNDISLKSHTAIQDVTLTYNDRALYSITVGADSVNNQIPVMSADWGGILCSVPNNYNASSKVYTGGWGGTFATTKVWTDNPAWLLLELIKSNRFGLGQFVSATDIDVFSFYNAAVYCDGLVADGKGTGTFENRFTFNAQLMVREDAWKTCQAIASAFRSVIYVHNGYIRLSQDRPTTYSRIFGNSNVIDGLFSYSATESRTRYTACNTSFSDVTDNCLPKTVTEKDSTGIARYGYNTIETVAYGATTEGQARRDAKWTVDTSINNTEIVEFVCGPQHADIEPGEVFKLMDTDYSATTQEGRLVGVSGYTITLDKPLTQSGSPMDIDLLNADGKTIDTAQINAYTGTRTVVTLNVPFSGGIGSEYIITGGIAPRQFRCLSMVETDNFQYRIKGLQYDPNKFARVEGGILIPTPVYWQQPNMLNMSAPTSIVISPVSIVSPEFKVERSFNVSWTAPADHSASSYRISWRRDNGSIESLTSVLPYARVPAPASGTYEFFINAINSIGLTSATLNGSYALDISNGTGSTIGTPTALVLRGGATTFSYGALQVQWVAPTAVVTATLKDYEVTLQVPAGAVFKTFYVTSPQFDYSYDENVRDGGPRTNIQVNVKARDTLNKSGTAITATFGSTTAPVVSGLAVKGGGATFTTRDLEVTWNCVDGSINFTQSPSFGFFLVQVFNGATQLRSAQVLTTSFVYTYDMNKLDNGGTAIYNPIINITAFNNLSQNGATASSSFFAATPAAPTLTASGNFTTKDVGFTFGGANPLQFNGYLVSFGGTSRSEIVTDNVYNYTYQQNTADHNGIPARSVVVAVQIMGIYNNISASTTSTYTNPVPNAPTVVTSVGSELLFMSATPQTADTDVTLYEFHVSTTNLFTPSGSTAGTGTCVYVGPNSMFSMPATGGTTYYVKCACRDGFTTATWNYSTQTSGTVITAITGSDYQFTGLKFTANSSTNVVTWTSGFVLKRAGASGVGTNWSLTGASSAALNTVKFYLYWDEATPTLILASTLITDATGANKRILATYNQGMNLIIAGGSAMIDGTTTIFPGTISAPLLVAGSAVITGMAQMGNATIGTAQIADAVITTAKIVDASIITAKIANLAVTSAQIASATITDAQIASATITGAKIANATIGNAQITNASISAVKIIDASITSAQIADATITGAKIVNATIGTAHIANAAITTALIQTAGITTALIEDAAITSAKIGTLSVDTIHIKDTAVTSTTVQQSLTDKATSTVASGGIYYQSEYGVETELANMTFVGNGYPVIIQDRTDISVSANKGSTSNNEAQVIGMYKIQDMSVSGITSSTSAIGPGTVFGGFTGRWTTLTNIGATANSTFGDWINTGGASTSADWLQCTGFNFASIPSTATLLNLQIEITGVCDGSVDINSHMRVQISNTTSNSWQTAGQSDIATMPINGASTARTVGRLTTCLAGTWGPTIYAVTVPSRTLTVANLLAGNFSLLVTPVTNISNNRFRIDSINIIAHYTSNVYVKNDTVQLYSMYGSDTRPCNFDYTFTPTVGKTYKFISSFTTQHSGQSFGDGNIVAFSSQRITSVLELKK